MGKQRHNSEIVHHHLPPNYTDDDNTRRNRAKERRAELLHKEIPESKCDEKAQRSDEEANQTEVAILFGEMAFRDCHNRSVH